MALVVGPSGYGLPLRTARDVTDDELRLAFLASEGERGGIGGLRALTRHLEAAGIPLVFIPGVIHLSSVPAHRKLNRVDLGTADKVCAAALAIADQAGRRGVAAETVSLILLELGGAFTAGLAVSRGRIVDGVGGTSGPIGWRASGALDAEVAYLAGEVSKATLFQGGVATVVRDDPALEPVALLAYVEGAARAVRQLLSAAPEAEEILLSGRMAADATVGAASAAAARATGIRPPARRLRVAGKTRRARRGPDRRRPDGRSPSRHGRAPGHRTGTRNGVGSSARDFSRRGAASARAWRCLTGGRVSSSPGFQPGPGQPRRIAPAIASPRSTRSVMPTCARWRTVLPLRRETGLPYTAVDAARAASAVRAVLAAYTSNLENHPEAVALLARGRRLLGNPPAVLRRVRNPILLMRTLAARGLPAPADAGERAADVPRPPLAAQAPEVRRRARDLASGGRGAPCPV